MAGASRALVAIFGGWIVVHATDGGLVGLGIVTAAGLILAGAMIAIMFRRSMAPQGGRT